MATLNLKFIADHNVGKLARRLRMMGFDTVLFTGENDADMVDTAAMENRIILTRDTGVMERRVITGGQVKALLITSDRLDAQLSQVVTAFQIDSSNTSPFTLCIKCNAPLSPLHKADARERVPPYVFRTQDRFVECPVCRRVYWQGTHWQAMTRKLGNMLK